MRGPHRSIGDREIEDSAVIYLWRLRSVRREGGRTLPHIPLTRPHTEKLAVASARRRAAIPRNILDPGADRRTRMASHLRDPAPLNHPTHRRYSGDGTSAAPVRYRGIWFIDDGGHRGGRSHGYTRPEPIPGSPRGAPPSAAMVATELGGKGVGQKNERRRMFTFSHPS